MCVSLCVGERRCVCFDCVTVLGQCGFGCFYYLVKITKAKEKRVMGHDTVDMCATHR